MAEHCFEAQKARGTGKDQYTVKESVVTGHEALLEASFQGGISSGFDELLMRAIRYFSVSEPGATVPELEEDLNSSIYHLSMAASTIRGVMGPIHFGPQLAKKLKNGESSELESLTVWAEALHEYVQSDGNDAKLRKCITGFDSLLLSQDAPFHQALANGRWPAKRQGHCSALFPMELDEAELDAIQRALITCNVPLPEDGVYRSSYLFTATIHRAASLTILRDDRYIEALQHAGQLLRYKQNGHSLY